jgi:uncharacterized protein (TIGR02453 family)
MPFAGFPESTVRLLGELSQNNERTWFDAHRSEFEEGVVEPAKALVVALGARLRELDPELRAIPRVHASIHGFERRTRFRFGDAGPYREYLDLWFWSGPKRAWENSGFFLRLSPATLVLASGMVEFQKPTLARYREHVLDEARGPALAAIVDELRGLGYAVVGERYKRPPRGVAPDHRRASLLKHGGLIATLSGDHPEELGSARFVDFALSHFARMAPLHAWLVALHDDAPAGS